MKRKPDHEPQDLSLQDQLLELYGPRGSHGPKTKTPTEVLFGRANYEFTERSRKQQTWADADPELFARMMEFCAYYQMDSDIVASLVMRNGRFLESIFDEALENLAQLIVDCGVGYVELLTKSNLHVDVNTGHITINNPHRIGEPEVSGMVRRRTEISEEERNSINAERRELLKAVREVTGWTYAEVKRILCPFGQVNQEKLETMLLSLQALRMMYQDPELFVAPEDIGVDGTLVFQGKLIFPEKDMVPDENYERVMTKMNRLRQMSSDTKMKRGKTNGRGHHRHRRRK